VLSCVDALSRKFLNHPFTFTYELTEIMMVLVTFLGLGYITSKDGHIEVDILVPRLPFRTQNIIRAFNAFVGIGIFSLISWQAFIAAIQMITKGNVTEILRLSLTPFIIVVSVGALWMCLELLIMLVCSIKNAIRGIPK
jgi:TRAP-type C4-dicarboxylate transport system permease small subunit